ncbi:hypothetical protein HG421_01115 [Xanthomonas campestris pv. badrii]|uniref:Uncharacterized protein n=1 Tax=Xanthomonas campestris pv. badrii TaxID=149696 RepID=A0A7Z2V7F4_XANCA|nr:hypothetical protein [Xanthomonas campestris]MCC4605436.1 hypothetical protein [Xanthomonas campestris pv. parthenii]QJD66461.1 hypothetical protein HG421_01115 [Xanthomonas campestris pv. badrii]
MFKDMIAAGGPGLLIPIVLFALIIYATRGLFDLHGRRSQHRREFLEHWDPKRADDDLWLEVTVRHLYGQPLPAHVIRTALSHPHCSQALMDLSEIWEFYQYDSDTQTVSWAHTRHKHAYRRWLNHRWSLARYFLLACLAMVATYVATLVNGLSQWIYATAAALCGIGAFISLWRCDAEKKAADAGEIWIKRINDSLRSPHATNDLTACETGSSAALVEES